MKNRMVLKLNIDLKISSDCINDIVKLFPNLTELSLDLSENVQSENDGSIEIKETKYCKIKKLFLNIRGNRNVKLFIGPYENLTSIRLNTNEYKNTNNLFPLFEKIVK